MNAGALSGITEQHLPGVRPQSLKVTGQPARQACTSLFEGLKGVFLKRTLFLVKLILIFSAGIAQAGVVSSHDSLIPASAEQAGRTQAKILICHGAQDPMNQPDALTAADKRGMAALAYNPSADRRSWRHMTCFLDEVLSKM
jgi:hypothetical protein